MATNTIVIISSIIGGLTAIAGLINILINISTHSITSTIRINTNSRLSEALAKITSLLTIVSSLRDTITILLAKVANLEALLMKVTGTTSIEDARKASKDDTKDF